MLSYLCDCLILPSYHEGRKIGKKNNCCLAYLANLTLFFYAPFLDAQPQPEETFMNSSRQGQP
jgi:hypothetical protein